MNEAKHTKGPWQFYADTPSVEPNWHIVTNTSRLRVIANVHIEPGNAMDIANACLISASPTMLAALVELLAAEEAVFPAFEEGQAAQDAWALRKTNARYQASVAIALATEPR